jgi:acyl-coenzyme A thioesterase PaaI-like protein
MPRTVWKGSYGRNASTRALCPARCADSPAVSVFDEATAVRRVGEGRYEVRPDDRFAIAGAVNGGVLLASMLRAVLHTAPHPYPIATSAHFLRAPRPEPAQAEVSWLKQGKVAATARATLVQDGRPVLETTVTTGALGDPADTVGLSWTGEPPWLPPIGECRGAREAPHRVFSGYAKQVDLRLDPATAGWTRGQPAGVPEMRGYFQLAEERDPDALLLALAVDSLPPAVFGLEVVGWSPTVELTWYMRAVPAPGPLRVAARCRHVSGGWFDEEAEVWDSAGHLVAQSRQIALVGRGAR